MTPDALGAAEALRDEVDRESPQLRLYDVADQIAQWEDVLVENGGELTPEIEASLDSLQGDFRWKAERICRLIQNYKRTSEAYKAERERLQAHERAYAKSAESLQTYLLTQMEKIGMVKLDAGVFKVSVQRNARPSIEWPDTPASIPEPFKRVRIELDGNAAYDAYRRKELPFGFVVTLGRHLRVR